MADRPPGELWRWQHSRAKPAPMRMEPIEFGKIEGWAAGDHCAALECYMQSAAKTGQPLPKGVDAGSSPSGRERARAFFEENFTAYRVLEAPGLLTSYFEPVLKGARQPSAAFVVPVLRRPADLFPLPQGHALTELGLTAGKKTAGGFEPYFTRGEIAAGALAGQGLEILYLANPVEAFVMHVQGSGLVELDDGASVRLTFDGKNGHPYTSVAKLLIERGELTREDAHLEGDDCVA